MIRIHNYLLIILLAFSQAVVSQNSNVNKLRTDFVKGYRALQLPYLQVNYTQNLGAIKQSSEIKNQEAFFLTFQKQLKNISVHNLDEYQLLDYHLMRYEIDLNLERIFLEKQWNYNTHLDDTKSIYSINNGKKWYAYLLKRWVNANVTPDEIYNFGLQEIEKVKTEMKAIQVKSGLSEKAFNAYLNDTSFYFNTVKDIQFNFEKVKKEVAKKSAELFPYIDKVPDVTIAQGTNEALSQVPAYYNNNTFFYNYFDKPFNKRQFDWIYIHEGIPGHHYQMNLNNVIKRTEIQQLFWYSGFVEGWGAYVEYLGKELGVYKTIYDEYGKWEWDLIRSVRVALDVAINYYGWSDDKALLFWKEHIKHQDNIGVREINRMKRWPAQVVTYKYGANKFLELLKQEKSKHDFSFKLFHKKLLKYGDVPLTKSIVDVLCN
ncbi:DUF885 domain-containing protein [Pontimicrobium sp. IMCC45349]|uniref:DUF885 domain-containing protein n=1 Tax=Pontimicrobium sp. IMCC45349 TaxID=3391574 RepID=UPI0039A2DE8B